MIPRIETLPKKKLIGRSVTMSLADDKTSALWQGFMPRRQQIKNTLGTDFYCIQVYDKLLDFKDFNTNTVFEKWAAIEVLVFNDVPDEMKTFTLMGGLYAVFIHKGSARDFHKTAQFIFGHWLPSSEYILDSRDHFEVLGEKYKNNSPDSEEEVWIPIKLKTNHKV